MLCALAAARVLVYSAAFPFFNNVDEQAHVDLVLKYSQGKLPRGLGPMSAEGAQYFSLYGTYEYLNKPERFAGGKFPTPLWQQSPETREASVRRLIGQWEAQTNYEAGEPPLYYALAGSICKFASICGIRGGVLLYLLRFLNAGVAVGLVWIGYIAGRFVFPGRTFPCIALAALAAFLPQDTFYSVQNAVMSPLFFGIAFIGLLKLFGDEPAKVSTGVYTGLCLAASCLVKTANIPLVFFATVALFFRMAQLTRARRLHSYSATFISLAACVIVPLGVWVTWNYHAFGDATATAAKIQHFGLTRKPMSEWWSHPLFTSSGLSQFWPELMASFWRGEFVWHGERLASATVDNFYWLSSLFVLVITMIDLLSRKTLAQFERSALWLALGSFLAAVAFLAGLSIAFDFGACFYPSREAPYFTTGRLLSGATIPFLLIYAYALDRISSWTKLKWVPFALLAIIIAVVTISEVGVNRPAFASQYNFFHMVSNVKL